MEGLEGEFQGGEPGSAGHRVAGNYLVLPVEGVDEVGTQLYAAFFEPEGMVCGETEVHVAGHVR